MQWADAPTRTKFNFQGYFTDINGIGIQYYDANMQSTALYDVANDMTLFTYWQAISYYVA